MTRALKTGLATVAGLATAATLALTPLTAGAEATTPHGNASPPTASKVSRVFALTDGLAGRIAGRIADPAARRRVASATASGSADLLTIERGTSLGQAVRKANVAVQEAKGLPASSGSLLRLRLANPRTRAGLTHGQVPLIAAEPTDDSPAAITAYDPLHGKVLLDPAKAPTRPVLMVGVDVAKAVPLGTGLIRRALGAHGIAAAKPNTAQAGGFWTTKINSVHLNDDEEPWYKGDAEIYSIVGGFGLDGKPTVNIVQMPYLTDDHTDYSPNQTLISWNAYKYNTADVVMMEDDGDTNYQQLATAIAGALLTITDQGSYIPLVNAILSALPVSWWTDDPDYVDSWYALTVTTTGGLNGAAHNGWMQLSPSWVSEL